jgi:NDP-sugar pyrophosphorylase family protein
VKIKYCLILSAGFGTRMGAIGKTLPKPVWPIFDKSLIELQVNFIEKNYNPEIIFINTFHQEEILNNTICNINSKSEIKVIKEKELLGVGGAINNVAHILKHQGELLVINSDQFIFYNFNDDIANFRDNENPITLLGMHVSKNSSYSKLILNNQNILKNIIKEQKSKMDYITYTGNCIIDLSVIKKLEIKFFNFFEHIANYNYLNVHVYIPSNLKYYDFVNKNLYFEHLYNLFNLFLQNKKNPFVDFLIEQKAININKVNKKLSSYGLTKSKNLLNFSKFEVNNKNSKCRNIILNSDRELSLNATNDSLTYFKQQDPLNH